MTRPLVVSIKFLQDNLWEEEFARRFLGIGLSGVPSLIEDLNSSKEFFFDRQFTCDMCVFFDYGFIILLDYFGVNTPIPEVIDVLSPLSNIILFFDA